MIGGETPWKLLLKNKEMINIFGLGNPEEKYFLTRHNIGFLVIDALREKLNFPKFVLKKKFVAEVSSGKPSAFTEEHHAPRQCDTIDNLVPRTWGITKAWSKKNDSALILAKPQTYMNESGRAIGAIAAYYRIKPDRVWIVYDDKDLPLGTLRIRKKGGSAGHKGIESIIQHLGKKEFIRFRIGTAPAKKFTRATTDFVLGKFNKTEQKIANQMINQTVQAIIFALEQGIDEAINNWQVSNKNAQGPINKG